MWYLLGTSIKNYLLQNSKSDLLYTIIPKPKFQIVFLKVHLSILAILNRNTSFHFTFKLKLYILLLLDFLYCHLGQVFHGNSKEYHTQTKCQHAMPSSKHFLFMSLLSFISFLSRSPKKYQKGSSSLSSPKKKELKFLSLTLSILGLKEVISQLTRILRSY